MLRRRGVPIGPLWYSISILCPNKRRCQYLFCIEMLLCKLHTMQKHEQFCCFTAISPICRILAQFSMEISIYWKSSGGGWTAETGVFLQHNRHYVTAPHFHRKSVNYPAHRRLIITFWRTRKMKAPFVDPRLCFMPYPRYDIIVCSGGDNEEQEEGKFQEDE